MSKLYFVMMKHHCFQLSSSIVFLFIKMVRISDSFGGAWFHELLCHDYGILRKLIYSEVLSGKKGYIYYREFVQYALSAFIESSGNVMTNFFWLWHYHFKFNALLH